MLSLAPGLKAIVHRLFADPAAREDFLSNPDVVFVGQPLSREERRVLLRLHTRLVAANGAGVAGVGPLLPWP